MTSLFYSPLATKLIYTQSHSVPANGRNGWRHCRPSRGSSVNKKRSKVKKLGASVLNRHINFVHRNFTQSNGAES